MGDVSKFEVEERAVEIMKWVSANTVQGGVSRDRGKDLKID